MHTYLVGGAVRDALLGLPVTDRDWVVVGASPEAMRARGFRAVGRDFPVFLHPESGEEYALARLERKSGTGYHGFRFESHEAVTLEEDLLRRDLTINAIARDDAGRLVDPFGGQRDLARRTLRHVSPAFVEDPVRVLRVARFMARLADLGFRIAPETLELMQAMVTAGELAHLVPERVWQELESALATSRPRAFVETLRACGALAVVLPEIDGLYGVPQPRRHHPEVDSALHTLLVLDRCTELDGTPETRFAALCHDLGKASSPPEDWPSHHGHEERGARQVRTLAARLKLPTRFRDLAERVARYHTHCHRVRELTSATLLEVLEALDAVRRPERVDAFLTICTADSRGRLDSEEDPYPQAALFASAAAAMRGVDAAGVVAALAKGDDRAAAVRAARREAIRSVQARWPAD